MTELAPSAPWRVRAELQDGVNVRLSWRPSRQYPQFVTSYLVYYRSTEASASNAPTVVSSTECLQFAHVAGPDLGEGGMGPRAPGLPPKGASHQTLQFLFRPRPPTS